jgi:hypothetical protein
MRMAVLSLAVVVFLAPVALPGGEKDNTDNPFRTAKVGDYITHKVITSMMGKVIEANVKQTITAKSETEATVQAITTILFNTFPSLPLKIDLTKPFGPEAVAVLNRPNVKFEKKGEGKEKIKVGDKIYNCNWIAGKVTVDSGKGKIESEAKYWFSKSVPLTGMVKAEMTSTIATIRMEFVESGSAK